MIKIIRGEAETTIHHVVVEYGGSDLFVFCLADCYFPTMYLVAGDSLEDAYDNFLVIPAIEEQVRIEDFEMGDYDPETVKYNDNNVAIDTDNVQGWSEPVTADDFH